MDDRNQSNSPRDVLRDGNLKSTIWRNDTEKGPFYSVNLARTYRDGQGELRDSHSFAGTDLLRISELARKTYDRTQELRREDRQTERDAARDNGAPLLEQGERAARRGTFEANRAPSREQQRPPQRSR